MGTRSVGGACAVLWLIHLARTSCSCIRIARSTSRSSCRHTTHVVFLLQDTTHAIAVCAIRSQYSWLLSCGTVVVACYDVALCTLLLFLQLPQVRGLSPSCDHILRLEPQTGGCLIEPHLKELTPSVLICPAPTSYMPCLRVAPQHA